MRGMVNRQDKKKPLDRLDEPDFLQKLREGDPAAFHELIETMKDRVYNLTMRLIRNADDAEEVVQEAFMTIYDKIGTFQGRSKLSTWIYAIAYNAALNRIKKNKNLSVTFEDENALNFEQSWTRNKNVVFNIGSDDPVLQKEMQEKLEEAIESLPEGYREIFILKEIENMSVKDVAEIFGINPGAVKTRLHRARLFLRAKLSDYWNAVQP